MMSKAKKIKKAKTYSTTLVRADWDFSSCPLRWAEFCLDHELQREKIQMLQTKGEPVPEDLIYPPYLLCSYYTELHDWTDEDWENLYPKMKGPKRPENWHSVMRGKSSDLRDSNSRMVEFDEYLVLRIKWNHPDKQLIEAFKFWLKKNRPKPPQENRGNPKARKAFATLKALGAYRLLKTMTAEEARTFTAQFIRGGLFSKLPDWYEAKAKITKFLKSN